jgi:hypothetical protein
MAKKRLTMRFRIPQWKRKREEGERLEQQRGLEYERKLISQLHGLMREDRQVNHGTAI